MRNRKAWYVAPGATDTYAVIVCGEYADEGEPDAYIEVVHPSNAKRFAENLVRHCLNSTDNPELFLCDEEE